MHLQLMPKPTLIDKLQIAFTCRASKEELLQKCQAQQEKTEANIRELEAKLIVLAKTPDRVTGHAFVVFMTEAKRDEFVKKAIAAGYSSDEIRSKRETCGSWYRTGDPSTVNLAPWSSGPPVTGCGTLRLWNTPAVEHSGCAILLNPAVLRSHETPSFAALPAPQDDPIPHSPRRQAHKQGQAAPHPEESRVEHPRRPGGGLYQRYALRER